MRVQNTSHAVMSQRTDGYDGPDDFPTPPWATRALLRHVLSDPNPNHSCLEPACGVGHMTKVLNEYFNNVHSSDAFNYGFGEVRDFLAQPYQKKSFDWVITNPPFKLAKEFVLESLRVARIGVAILARTVFLESNGRYKDIFLNNPPTIFAQFVERVPMVKGRLDPTVTTATGYAWFCWELNSPKSAQLVWIPPCRRLFEKEGDYSAIVR